MADAGFFLPALDYGKDDLSPALTIATFNQHHEGHHKAYVDNLNKLAGEAGKGKDDLVSIIRAAKGTAKGLFNNAAQHFNHSFYWKSLAADGGAPEGRLAELINRDFGSVDALKEKLVAAGVGHFASGWAWLVLKGDKLEVTDTHDADTPVAEEGVLPLLTLDVWEHAYYLDHQRNRKAYLDAIAAKHLNWAFASELLAAGSVDKVDFGIGNKAA